jgi:hypothetical protein
MAARRLQPDVAAPPAPLCYPPPPGIVETAVCCGTPLQADPAVWAAAAKVQGRETGGCGDETEEM